MEELKRLEMCALMTESKLGVKQFCPSCKEWFRTWFEFRQHSRQALDKLLKATREDERRGIADLVKARRDELVEESYKYAYSHYGAIDPASIDYDSALMADAMSEVLQMIKKGSDNDD